jgi:RNA polymerase sigma-70 factor (ECF subfamily)
MEARIGQLLEHARWVRGLARCLTHDDASADDLAQDAWIAALRNPPALEGETRGWLGAVMRNRRRMELRSDRRRLARESSTVDPDARVASAADLADEVELGRILAEELLLLDEPYRETLLLTFYRDLSSAEIGAQCSIPAATVRTHVRVGLERLRRRLDDRYGERATWKRAFVPMAALPRLAVKGALMGKGTAVAIAALGALGLFAVQHHATSNAPTASTPPIVAAARSALQKRIEQLHQQKPAHDALVAAIEAKKPSLPSAAPPPPSPPTDRIPGQAWKVGDLDPEYIRASIQDALSLFKQCFEDALVDHPDLNGRIQLEFTIEGDPDVGGVVSTSKVDDEQSTLKLPELRECFEQTIYAARFPAPADHGVVLVSYPFKLLAAADAGE